MRLISNSNSCKVPYSGYFSIGIYSLAWSLDPLLVYTSSHASSYHLMGLGQPIKPQHLTSKPPPFVSSTTFVCLELKTTR